MLIENVRFNFAGRKYVLGLDDGHVYFVRHPGGNITFHLPPELEASPRLQQFLHRRQEEIRDIRESFRQE